MTKRRFENVLDEIWQYGEWWCNAGGEHCADVITKALNIFSEENNQLKSELSMKDDLIRQLRIKLNEDWYNKWKKTIQQYSDVCEELVEVNKDYKKIEKDRGRLNNVVQHVWNVLLDVDRDELCFEERIFFDELCNKLGFDLSRIKMIEIDVSIGSINDE